jgi:MFS family permease
VAKRRLILVASVLGSGAVFLESTITSVAIPAIGRDLHLGMAGLQWVMDGYLLPVSALILLGGALGDRFARERVFAVAGFARSAILYAALCVLGAMIALTAMPNRQ